MMNTTNAKMNTWESSACDYFKYVSWGFVSYWYQVKEVLDFDPETVLEIGVGKEMFYNYIKNLGVRIVSLDLDRTSK